MSKMNDAETGAAGCAAVSCETVGGMAVRGAGVGCEAEAECGAGAAGAEALGGARAARVEAEAGSAAGQGARRVPGCGRIAITGTSGYSGRYMAREAVRRGYEVLGLTNSPRRADDPAGQHARLCWEDEEALVESLRGCVALINTYWVRFDHGDFSHGRAVENTKTLFRAAQRAGVAYVVHTSITQPDAASALPYFRGKAELEAALAASGLRYTILRPAVLFGESAEESILINNMAWVLRRLPLVGMPGDGQYRMAPIHVEDYARLALDVLEEGDAARVVDAVGPETYSFRALWQEMGRALGRPRLLLGMPPCLVRVAAALLGAWQGDVMLTRDEIRGLMEDRLAVSGAAPTGRCLSAWLRAHADELGRCYASELARRR